MLEWPELLTIIGQAFVILIAILVALAFFVPAFRDIMKRPLTADQYIRMAGQAIGLALVFQKRADKADADGNHDKAAAFQERADEYYAAARDYLSAAWNDKTERGETEDKLA
jgi:hypothetical protein